MKNQEKPQENKKTTIDSIINDALKNLKNIVDANTIFGEEVVTKDGSTLIPVSKIIVGFVAGGGEFDGKSNKKSKTYPFAGGSGAGFTVVPMGFITGKDGEFKFVSTQDNTKYDELVNLTNKSIKLILDTFKKK